MWCKTHFAEEFTRSYLTEFNYYFRQWINNIIFVFNVTELFLVITGCSFVWICLMIERQAGVFINSYHCHLVALLCYILASSQYHKSNSNCLHVH